MKDKIENIFKSYPDVSVSEFKFLINDLVELFYKQQKEIKKEIIRELPKEVKLNDKFTKEEEKFIIKVYGKKLKTSEWMRERRYGYNTCLSKIKEIIKKI